MTIISTDAGDAAVQILDAHRYFRRGRCRCGTELTGTHAQHVLHALQMAGLDVVWR